MSKKAAKREIVLQEVSKLREAASVLWLHKLITAEQHYAAFEMANRLLDAHGVQNKVKP